jgi:hypothetical protein
MSTYNYHDTFAVVLFSSDIPLEMGAAAVVPFNTTQSNSIHKNTENLRRISG